MPGSGGGCEHCSTAQASVDIDTGLSVTRHVTQQTNDTKEVVLTLAQLEAQKEALGDVEHLLGDAGYFSEDNVKATLAQGITPSFSTHRESHNAPLKARLEASPEHQACADPVDDMKRRLATREGRALYARRKSTIEPACGLIKQMQGFEQFLVREAQAVQGEWNLVCIGGYTMKRMYELSSSR